MQHVAGASRHDADMSRGRIAPLVRWLAMLAALMAVAALFALTRNGGGTGSASGSAGATATVSHPGGSVTPAIDETAWWRLESFGGFGPVSVSVGTLESGPTAHVDLRVRDVPADRMVALPNRRVVGPAGGLVVLIEEDDGSSILTAVDARSGDSVELARTADVIVDAGFGRGTNLVFLTAAEGDGRPIGLWNVDLSGNDGPQLVVDLVAHDPGVRLAAVAEWITELVVSLDGDLALVHRCVQLECEIRAVDLSTGEEVRRQVDWGIGPAALLGDILVLDPPCAMEDCRIDLLNIETGERRLAPGSPDRELFEVATVAEPRAMVVTNLRGPVVGPGPGPVALEVLDLETLTFEPVMVDLGSIALLGRWGLDAGVELAPATILVTGSAPAAGGQVPGEGYFLVDLVTGRATPVPDLGQPFIQG